MLHRYYILTLFATLSSAVLGENVRVTLPQGTLIGSVMKSAKGREFQAFQCIPYAKPPVDDLRFKLPQPAEPWNGTLDAAKECPACPQMNPFIVKIFSGEEDCLVLNVYTTQISLRNETDKLPVMVYIYGGCFSLGTSSVNVYSPKMIMDRQVVLVNINYRLGALGFLSTGDEVSPGNYGLYDQVEALKWVKKNIAYFGGDPQKVTIFGESAGAASVSHLIVSPKAKDHFKAAIMESGSSFSVWALTEHPYQLAQSLAQRLGCAVQTSKIILECLKTKSAKEIVSAQQNMTTMPHSIVFAPVVENTPDGFFPEHPFQLITNNKYNKVPTISGVNQEDGAIAVLGLERITDPYSPEFLEANSMDIGLMPIMLGRQAIKEITELYFQNVDRNNKSEVRKTLIKAFTDGSFNVGAEKLTRMLSQNGLPTYTYRFTYRGELSVTKLYGITEDYGVSHMDELPYLFSMPIGDLKRDDDKQVSELFLDMWTNFAIYHDPTPENGSLPFKWLQREPFSPKYLDINRHPRMVNEKLAENVEFWDRIFENNTVDPNI